MNEYAELLAGIERHLVLSGLTFNAELPTDPIVIRPMRVDVLVASIMEYLNATGYANTTKVS